MGAITPVKLMGVGQIVNASDNVVLSNQAEFSISNTLNTMDIPVGDTFQSSALPTGVVWGGRMGFRDITAAIIAASIGGTVDSTDVIKHISREQATVTTATTTLTQTAYKPTGVTLFPMEIVDQNGVTYLQVASGPSAGEFSVAGTTVTFDASANDIVVYQSFYYTEASGSRIKPDPTTVVANKTFLFAGKLYSTRLKTWEGYMTCLIMKLQRSGEMSWGTGVGDAATMGFDYIATVEVPEDLIICTED